MKNIDFFFLFLNENTYYGYSLEGTSNEYPQHMFPWRNKKKKIGGYQLLSGSMKYKLQSS